MSGRTEGGNVERKASSSQGASDTVRPLTDSRFAVPIALPFGHTRAETLIEFVKEAEAHDGHEIRLALRRMLLFLCPSGPSARAVHDAASTAGFITDPDDPRASIAACPGSPACASGHIPARVMAAEFAMSLSRGASLDLHVSGCEKRCARPGHQGLTVLGQSDGAALVLEGAGASPVARVAPERAVAAIGRVAALMAAERKDGESETACLARIGMRRLGEAFAGEERAAPN